MDAGETPQGVRKAYISARRELVWYWI